MGRDRWRRLGMLCVLVAIATRVHAAAGDPDPDFGAGGVITTDFGGAPDGFPTTQAAHAVLVQPDGRIVVAGQVVRTMLESGFGLVRYEADGSLDPTFGTDGKVLTVFPAGAQATALVRQPDGHLVAGGAVYSTFGTTAFGLARYAANGELDPTFGTGGVALATFDLHLNLTALALQPDGKIVAVGYDSDFGTVIALARFNANGTLDPGFGAFGWVETSFGPGPSVQQYDDARAVVLQPDGKIVIAGTAASAAEPDPDFQLVRYLPNGMLDPTFGVGGRVRTHGTGDSPRSLHLLADGRLVATGVAAGGAMAVVRYQPNGELDPDFGAGGTVVTEVVLQFLPSTSMLLPDGKLLVAGTIPGEVQLGYDFAVVRFDGDGSLDAGFGEGGVAHVHISHPGPSIETANALVVQPDSKIVAAGYVHEPFAMYPNFVHDIAVVRFLGDCGNGALDGVEACDAGPANGTASSCCAITCAFRTSTQTCRPAVDTCDVGETCTGTSGDCPDDVKQGTSTLCRMAADACDAAERCDGVSDDCPADALAPAGSVCRPVAGPCDVAEHCTGTSAACPSDGFGALTTVCRESAGVCDHAERCDGASAACPADVKEAAGTTCRASAGACDVAESCDGAADACPADAFAASGTPCRPAAGDCDVAEVCSGAAPACPADTGLPDGDADGVCDAQDLCPDAADPMQLDGDGDGIGDACDPCTSGAPATKSKLTATRLLAPGGDDTLVVKGQGVVPPTPEIDPVARGVRILVTTAGGRTVVDATIPGGAYDRVAKTGWKTNGGRTAWKYRGAGSATAGIQKVAIARTAAGVTKTSVKGRDGAYVVTASEIPVTATVVFDVPAAMGGQCLVVTFPAVPPARPSCTLVGSALRCR